MERNYRYYSDAYYNDLGQIQRILKNNIKCLFCRGNSRYSNLSKLNDPSEFVDLKINLNDFKKAELLKLVVKNHYSDILANFETYILYCKTEKIDVDFKKITERMNYIREYVKKYYDISLV